VTLDAGSNERRPERSEGVVGSVTAIRAMGHVFFLLALGDK
jgi:hypothetical protein